MLPGHANNYLAAVLIEGAQAAVAYADITTGEFAVTQWTRSPAGNWRPTARKSLLRSAATAVAPVVEARRAASWKASVVATHIRLAPRVPDPTPVYADLLADVRQFLADRASMAVAAGIPLQLIMIDAGLDLGKTEAMSTTLLRNSDDLVALGYPVFLSASNKRFLGVLAGTEVDDRREATWAAHALGIALGCRILRAHDVRGGRRVADTMAALLAERGP